MGLFHTIEVDSPLWQPMVYMGVFGLGLGLSMQTLTIAAQNAAPPRDMGVSTASATFFRQMGGTIGVAVFLSLLFSTVGDKIREAFERIAPTPAFQQALTDPAVLANPQNAQVIQGLQGGGVGNVLQDSSFLQQIDPRLARPFLEGFTDSIQIVFLVGMFVMVLAFIVSLFIKEIPLRTGNAIQAAMVEGGEALIEEPSQGRHVKPEAAPVPTVSSNGHQPVHGLIQDGDGTAVRGAILTLIDHNGQQVARSDADAFGRYQLQAPGQGAYVLIASAPGHQPHASPLKLDSQPVVVDLTLIGAGEIAGVIRAARAGSPVQGATVTLTDRAGHVIGAHPSASDGTYRFTSVGAGAYTLVVNAEGYRPAAVPLAVPEVGEVRQDVQLNSGAEVCGIARNHRGTPVSEARITVIDQDGSVVSVTTTDDNGRYRVTDLGPGEYTVIASGYSPTVDHLRLGDGEHMNHDVTLGFEEWK
jgi:hypothetical protein